MTLSKKKPLFTAVVSVLVLGSVAIANNVTLPHVFQPNTTARASEVNANFAAVKAAVDDSQTQINLLNSRSGTRIFRRQSGFTFPGSTSTATQTNSVDVFLGTVAQSGVVEVRLDVIDVNAYYGGNPEWAMSVAPVLNGAPGTRSNIAIDFFGYSPFHAPINGATTFAVSAGQSVSLRVALETNPSCVGGRGASPTCEIGFLVNAHFSPGVTLE